jgi:amino acid adenylation domain-containing protein/non-ribosomal peptide synthase protein (TIGR01720 family)
VANPECSIAQLPLLTKAERKELLYEWNDTATEYSEQLCVLQLFERQVEQTPEAIAVVFKDQQLTYQELNQRANQLAHYLRRLDVGPETLVGICVERSLEMVIGILGIFKSGGAYLPLDPSYPNDRILFMLQDAQVSVLISQDRFAKLLSQDNVHHVRLDSDNEVIAQEDIENPIFELDINRLAYVIYTSGSTGKPKGVMISHYQLANNYLFWENTFQLKTLCSNHLQVASFSFDVFSAELVRALCSGAKLVVCSHQSVLDPAELYKLMYEEKIDCVNFVPALLRNLIQYIESSEQNLPFIKLLIVGGDSWYVEEYQRLRHFLSDGIHLVNAYGVSEATIDSSYYEDVSLKPLSGLMPMGRPISNVQIYILDRQKQPAPIGVCGEIYIGGVGVARGYLNRPELTAEKFIADPFTDKSTARLYRTGDLGRHRSDGSIEFLGRIDNQVKLRGFRIELGEIEAALAEHPLVQQAVVIVQGELTNGEKLLAYVVSSLGEQISVSDLRVHLQAKLPAHMLPHSFINLDKFPLTPNGKVNRQALPQPNLNAVQTSQFVPPHTLAEKQLAEVWSSVLNIDRAGIHDNFFELGGDSILSIQIVARAHQVGLYFSVKQLFQHQTIAELAIIAKSEQKIQSDQGLLNGEVLLTPIQKWFFSQPLQEVHHYNQALLLSIPSNINIQFLPQVLSILLQHHDALRLRFAQQPDGHWKQHYSISTPHETLPWNVIDLSTVIQSQQAQALTQATEQIQQSLSLTEGPLVQITLFQMGDSQPARLLLTVHHLAIDGVSWRILLEDFANLYQQLQIGQNPVLPAKSSSFQQWANQLQLYAQSEPARDEANFWLNQNYQKVQSIPLDFTEDVDASCVSYSASVFHTLSVDKTLVLLQQVPAVYNTQVNDILLAALLLAYSRWSDQNDLLLDLEGHGREELFEQLDVSRTVGWFTSLYPVVLHKSTDNDFGGLIKSVKEQLRSIPSKGIGYGVLCFLSEDEALRERLQQLPKSQIGFNYLGQIDKTLEQGIFSMAKESIGQTVGLTRQRIHALEINAVTIEGQLSLEWSYSKREYRRETVELLGQMYIQALEEIIAHCMLPESGGHTPSDFPEAMLSQQQLDLLLQQLDTLQGEN